MRVLKTAFRCFDTKHVFHRQLSYQVKTVPALLDNYMYLLIHNESKSCTAIDPVEDDVISNHIISENLNLINILVTHHHWDHSGGNVKLLERFKDRHVNVIGYDNRIEGLNQKVNHNDLLTINGLVVRCLLTPCHTKGHMMYLISDNNTQKHSLFTGDTFFVAGCGKFFEGTPDDMYECVKLLTSLPSTTEIYCGHEYTIKNLEFAQSIDPFNESIKRKLQWATKQREMNLPTVPTTLAEELETNPYLQINNDHYRKLTGKTDPISIIKTIREMKDSYK